MNNEKIFMKLDNILFETKLKTTKGAKTHQAVGLYLKLFIQSDFFTKSITTTLGLISQELDINKSGAAGLSRIKE